MSLPSWAVPGREVVCINDGWSDRLCILHGIEPPSRVPMLNEVLRIATVHSVGRWGVTGGLLAFEGIPPFLYTVEYFRPLISQSDDIKAHFSELLNVSTPQRVEV